ncbi:MAG: cyclic pyranopterin monophosphate synthase MoaC [Pseudomonadota bacterium]
MDKPLTHLDHQGRAAMVDVGDKPATARKAVAKGMITMQPETLTRILGNDIKKGDVLSTARLAGIMAAKRTGELIPLCHPLPLDYVDVVIEADHDRPGLTLTATAQITAKTGVEMEALTAVSVAGLTIYDMAKSIDKTMHISDIRLVFKDGGQSGPFTAA